jgi:transposase
MQKNDQNYLEKVPPKDWERTPISVKKLVEKMGHRIEILEKKQAELLLVQQQLLEKVNKTSKNSLFITCEGVEPTNNAFYLAFT